MAACHPAPAFHLRHAVNARDALDFVELALLPLRRIDLSDIEDRDALALRSTSPSRIPVPSREYRGEPSAVGGHAPCFRPSLLHELG
jgi:hypothetical protein